MLTSVYDPILHNIYSIQMSTSKRRVLNKHYVYLSGIITQNALGPEALPDAKVPGSGHMPPIYPCQGISTIPVTLPRLNVPSLFMAFVFVLSEPYSCTTATEKWTIVFNTFHGTFWQTCEKSMYRKIYHSFCVAFVLCFCYFLASI